MSSSDQEAFRRLVVELRILEARAEELQVSLNFVNARLTELSIASMTLEGVEKETPDASIFVPIGGGSFIRAKLDSTDTVIVGTGAGVSIERPVSEAKQTVQSRIAEWDKTRTSIQQQLVQALGRIQEDRDKLQDLQVRLSQGERRAGVSEAQGRP